MTIPILSSMKTSRSGRTALFVLALGLALTTAPEPSSANAFFTARIAALRQRQQAFLARRAALMPPIAARRPAVGRAGGPLGAFQPPSAPVSLLASPRFQRQEAFFARALSLGRARGVRRPFGLDRLLTPDAAGRLPDSSVIDYLQWRRSLNPTRFDRFHPFIGSMLETDRIAQLAPPIPIPPTGPGIPPIDPPPGGPIDGGGHPDPDPQIPIPEPGSMAIWAAAATGLAVLWNRRRRLAHSA